MPQFSGNSRLQNGPTITGSPSGRQMPLRRGGSAIGQGPSADQAIILGPERGGSTGQIGEQTDQADDDQIDGDDVVQKPGHHQDENAGDQ